MAGVLATLASDPLIGVIAIYICPFITFWSRKSTRGWRLQPVSGTQKELERMLWSPRGLGGQWDPVMQPLLNSSPQGEVRPLLGQSIRN